VLHQENQQFKGLGSQRDRLAVAEQEVLPGFQLETTELIEQP
jgi:hypothetical protein